MKVFYPERDTADVVRHLKERLPALAGQLPISLVVLFGSCAKGSNTVASDVDLLIVYEGERRDDDFALAKKTLDLKGLEPHLYTTDEWTRVSDGVRRMVEGGVVLLGAVGR